MKNAYENNIEILKKVTDYLLRRNNINDDIELYKERILFYYNYIIETEEIEETELENLFSESSIKEVNMPTLAQKWLKQGIEEGEIKDKQRILIRQLSKKFGLDDKEKELIKYIKDKDKLYKAIDAFVFAEKKEEVLKELK